MYGRYRKVLKYQGGFRKVRTVPELFRRVWIHNQFSCSPLEKTAPLWVTGRTKEGGRLPWGFVLSLGEWGRESLWESTS